VGHEPRPYNDCCPRLDFPVLQLDAGEAISLDDQMCDGRVDDADTAGGELFALLAGQCVTLSEEGDVDGPLRMICGRVTAAEDAERLVNDRCCFRIRRGPMLSWQSGSAGRRRPGVARQRPLSAWSALACEGSVKGAA
jgi:hypothetical protein